MASSDKISIDVELKANLDKLTSQFDALDKKGAFKQNPAKRAELDAYRKEFQSQDLSQLDNKQLSTLSQQVKKFVAGIISIAKDFTDPEFQKSIEEAETKVSALLEKQSAIRDKLKSKSSGLMMKTGKTGRKSAYSEALKGSFNPDAAVFSNQVLYDNLPNFIKFDDQGNQKYSNKASAIKRARQLVEDPKKGGLTRDQIEELDKWDREYERHENEVGTKLQEAIDEVSSLTNKLNNANAALEKAQELAKQTASSGNGKDFGAQVTGATVTAGIDTQKSISQKQDENSLQKEASKAAKETKDNMEAATGSVNKHSNAVTNAIKQYFSWRLVINLIRNLLNGMIQTISELDKSLTEQAMVTGLTRDQTYQLVGAYQDLAKATGATTTEVASVVSEYLKQGESINDSLQLAQAAISAAKVARVDVGDSINYLTTALKGFKMEAEDAMQVSDKFAALAAASATDYDELAIALSKVASQANLAGMSMDYTLALLTQGLETTREAPETMGTALKTIIARMRELTDYGSTLEGDTDINTVESQLAYVGIALRDTNGELRSTEDVLDELGKKWDTLNTNQQAALAKALAGTRQQSRLIAMLDDYESVLEFQQISLQSTGATAAQSATYLQGIEAALNNIKVAYQSIVTTLSDSDFIVGFLNTIANLLTNLGHVLSSVGGTVTLVSVAFAGFVTSQVAGIAAAGGLSAANTILAKTIKAVNAAMAANPILAVVSITLTLVSVVGLAVMAFADFRSESEKAAEKVSDLSNEIYTLNQKAQAIKQTIDTVDELDNKLIKTKEDTEELENALSSVGDKLTEDEKKVYDTLTTTAEKIAYLKQVQEDANKQIDKDRQEQIRTLQGLSSQDRKNLLNGTSADSSTSRDAVRAIVNSQLYDSLNSLTDLSSEESLAIQEVTQSFVEQMDIMDAYDLAVNGTGGNIATLVANADKVTVSLEDGTTAYMNAAEVLNSEDYSLKEQVQAYESIEKALSGNTEALAAFQEQYSQYEVFQEMGDDVLNFIDAAGLSIDDLNNMYAAWDKLQEAGLDISQDEYESRFSSFLQNLAQTGGDIKSTIQTVFGDILSQFDEGTEDYINAFNTLVNVFGNTVSVGLLDMGQNMDSFTNTISNFYDKVSDWASMSDADKTEFISDNSDLFSGASGANLLNAFNTGDYEAIRQALATNQGLNDRLEKLRDQVDQELKIEEARMGDDRNEAYIALLKQYKKELDDEVNLFTVSLETRLNLEKEQLDTYKDYLEQRRDALKEELDDEKEAYQDYFDAINEQQETDDYNEQVDLLTTNIGKLASSTNAASQSQMRDLEEQLKDLTDERLETLRQNAQDAILSNIDDTISDIDDKFDDLLNSNQAMLAALTSDLEDPTAFVSNLITSQVMNGATANELESYIQSLASTFAGSGIDLSNVSVEEGENGQSIVLNVNGQTYNLSSSDQQSLFTLIMNALTQLGLK